MKKLLEMTIVMYKLQGSTMVTRKSQKLTNKQKLIKLEKNIDIVTAYYATISLYLHNCNHTTTVFLNTTRSKRTSRKRCKE